MDLPYQRLSRYRSELMGLAMLWVMLFHAYAFRFGVVPLDFIKQAGFAGVDVFILLSAMGLCISLFRRAQEGGSLWDFYRRRLVRILPAYWLVVGLYSLFLITQGRLSWGGMAWNLSAVYYWFHIPQTFNWYVPAILAFYLLSPAYAALLRRCRHKELLTAAMFPLSYGIYRLSIPLHLNYTEDFVCRLPAFALGMLMGHYLLTSQPLTRRHGAAWAALSAVGLSVSTLWLLGKLYISPCYQIAAQLVPVCLAAAWLLSRPFCAPVRRILRLLGSSSLEIYLINVIVTREFDTLAPYLDKGPRHLFFFAVTYSVNLLLGIALHRWISGRIPQSQSRPRERVSV